MPPKSEAKWKTKAEAKAVAKNKQDLTVVGTSMTIKKHKVPAKAKKATAKLIKFFKKYGQNEYIGEPVNMLEHHL